MSKRLFPALRLLLLAATFEFAGCALQPADKPAGGIQLEHYLAEQDYRGANAWLARQARNGADIQAEQRLLEKHMQSFEEANLSRVIEMEKKGDWIEALTTLDAALEKLPSSEVLLEKRAYTIAHRDPALQRSLEKELLIQAAYFRDSQKILDERQRIRRPTFSDTIHRARLRHEQGQLTDSLLICAKNAIKRGDYTRAERCLKAAKDQGDPKQLAALSQELAAARPKTKTQKQTKSKPAPDPEQEALRKQQQAIQRERRKLHAALDKGDLVTASNIILKLTQLEGETPELTTLNSSVEAAIAARVTELLESASTYYGNGDIAEARLQWIEILRLDPGNEQAEANIERAERVLNKLEELQQESATEPAASGSN